MKRFVVHEIQRSQKYKTSSSGLTIRGFGQFEGAHSLNVNSVIVPQKRRIRSSADMYYFCDLIIWLLDQNTHLNYLLFCMTYLEGVLLYYLNIFLLSHYSLFAWGWYLVFLFIVILFLFYLFFNYFQKYKFVNFLYSSIFLSSLIVDNMILLPFFHSTIKRP